MSPMQQIFLGLGAVAKKTYVDDVFSTNVYAGTSASTGSGTTQAINTGFDLASEGGLVWQKGRSFADNHFLIDTVRGNTKVLRSNTDGAETTTSLLSAFTSTGYTAGDNIYFNGTGKTFASWTFRKSPGFFDVVQITGDGSGAKAISHNLKSIPGLILVKTTGVTGNWFVYHRSVGFSNGLLLNDSYAASFASPVSAVSDTTFTITNAINENGRTYVAYVFAGGESTAATARSVDFDGNDALTSATSSDLSFGTGDYTVEFWCKFNATPNDSPLFENRLSGSASDATGFTITAYGGTNGVRIWWNGASRINGGAADIQGTGKWHHIAATRSSGTTYLFLDGTLLGTTTDSINITTNEAHIAGGKYSGGSSISHYFNGKISNFRIVKGTAVYTSSFKPSYEPLTNITNTKLLCCNNSSTTGSTVAPGTITAVGNPTASSDSPFDDPAGYVFGENEDQNVISMGSYVGNGSSGLGPVINLGWEPQYVLIKNVTSNSSSWNIWDSMRGIVAEGNDTQLYPDRSQEEYSTDRVDLTPTGFKLKQDNILINTDGSTYIYMCIRRPDGYVGKPLELGTSAFAMDTGAGSSTIPNYDSGFAVDIALSRVIASNDDWGFGARLLSGKRLKTNEDEEAGSGPDFTFDSNVGWNKNSSEGSSSQSWMWKRHAGMDVVAYEGNGVNGRSIAHSMNDVPEMMIVKRFSDVEDWTVYHTGLNGGTNPYTRLLTLNSTASEVDMTSTPEKVWKSTPTSTHFEIGSHDRVNTNGKDYLALLFSSITGVSKIGSYTGSTSNLTITTGFQPRFILIKGYDSNSNGRYWIVMDSLRGINPSGNTDYLFLNQSSAQNSNGPEPFISAISSTGFTLLAGKGDTNASFPGNFTRSYIYYAHA
jgi:hypothetical protein